MSSITPNKSSPNKRFTLEGENFPAAKTSKQRHSQISTQPEQQARFMALLGICEQELNSLRNRVNQLEQTAKNMESRITRIEGQGAISASVMITAPATVQTTFQTVTNNDSGEQKRSDFAALFDHAAQHFKSQEYKEAYNCFVILNDKGESSAEGFMKLCQAKELMALRKYDAAYPLFIASVELLAKTSCADGYRAARFLYGEYLADIKKNEAGSINAFISAYGMGMVEAGKDSFIAKVFGSRGSFLNRTKARLSEILSQRSPDLLYQDQTKLNTAKRFLAESRYKDAENELLKISLTSPYYSKRCALRVSITEQSKETFSISLLYLIEVMSAFSNVNADEVLKAAEHSLPLIRKSLADRERKTTAMQAKSLMEFLEPHSQEKGEVGQKINQLYKEFEALKVQAETESLPNTTTSN